MSSLHENLMKTLRSLGTTGAAVFEADGVQDDVWNCFPLVVSSCSKTSEGNDMPF